MPTFNRHKTNYPGVFFLLGSSPAGGKPEKIYYIRYRKDGKLIEEKVGRHNRDDMTPAKAAKIRLSKIEGERLPNREHRLEQEQTRHGKDNRWTLDRLFSQFVESKSHLKSLNDDKIRFNLHLKPNLGNKEIIQIALFDVDRIRITLLKTHKPATVKQVLVLLKRIVNFGFGKGLCDRLPFNVEMPKVNNQTTEDLTSEQLSMLLAVLDQEGNTIPANMMRMALYTGMRRSELFRLQWHDIDFQRDFITIRDPKGGTNQKIPLNPPARDVLQNQEKTDSPYVFPGKNGNQIVDNKVSINRIKEKAGLPKDFRPLHGLRHVYASMLASSGQVDMYTLQKLLTHKSPQMTQRYAHLRDETLKRASNLVGDLIRQAVNGNSEKQTGS